MDSGKFVGLLVFFLVGALVLVAFVPIIQETASATDTFTNDGYYHMTKYGTEDEIVLSWTYENPDVITVNGTDFVMNTPDDGNYNQTVVFGANSGARLYYNHSGCQFMHKLGTASADLSDNESLTVTCSGGTMTSVVTGAGTPSTLTASYDYIYCISENGPYVMKKAGTPAYMLADTEFIGMGVSTVAGTPKVLRIEGNIDDGATVTQITTSSATATYSTPIIDSTPINGYNDLYSLSKITFTGTVEDTTTNLTYSYFVVPYEITAEKTYHPDSTLSTIISLLPLIAGVGLLVFLVAEFLYTRYL